MKRTPAAGRSAVTAEGALTGTEVDLRIAAGRPLDQDLLITGRQTIATAITPDNKQGFVERPRGTHRGPPSGNISPEKLTAGNHCTHLAQSVVIVWCRVSEVAVLATLIYIKIVDYIGILLYLRELIRDPISGEDRTMGQYQTKRPERPRLAG